MNGFGGISRPTRNIHHNGNCRPTDPYTPLLTKKKHTHAAARHPSLGKVQPLSTLGQGDMGPPFHALFFRGFPSAPTTHSCAFLLSIFSSLVLPSLLLVLWGGGCASLDPISLSSLGATAVLVFPLTHPPSKPAVTHQWDIVGRRHKKQGVEEEKTSLVVTERRGRTQQHPSEHTPTQTHGAFQFL